jgi:hypothetical protein
MILAARKVAKDIVFPEPMQRFEIERQNHR